MSDVFEPHRRRMFGIAYGMLGQVMDAEDVVQDAYLRWSQVDTASIENPAAYLTTVTTRLAIDRLRSAQKRREEYVGPWLPEPVVPGADPGDVVAEAEQISLAFMTALERLNPVERAVLLLREVFDLDYAEIAAVVGRSPANCRQVAVRARVHVGDAGRSYRPSPERQEELLTAFVGAMSRGDLDQLTAVLAADVTLWSDGGGNVRAALHPIHGVIKVARFMLGIRKNAAPGDTFSFTTANGDPAIYLARDGRPFAVIALQMADEGIVGVRSVLNPEKIGHLERVPAPIPVVLD
ncbi:MAG: RNA polymerase sigma-70 factor [Acidimicrobiia bacterium]|nr:RNA polymerase sigma-70 factor [Acidimicrobiia bacterium]